MILWRDQVLLPLADKITDALLNIIHQERCGETVDTKMVNGVIESLGEFAL